MHNDVKLQNLSSLSQLYIVLAEIEKLKIYYLFDRSTTSSKQALLVMKTVKIRLRNKIEDEFLVAETFSLDTILKDFVSLK